MDPAVLSKLIFSLIGGLIGGLGIFLLGMKNMSEGMQAVAGDGLRRMISVVTNNRLLATGVGVLVTCIVQSSSITTVMVVGFVNGGLMTLAQAIGLIMGANIGTTITGWILVLKIGKYGLPLLGVAAFVYLFSKGDRWRYLAMAVMGVGMIFFGLELMKTACAVIKELPEFNAWFQRFRADNLVGMYLCMLTGCVLTVLVQSSSATLAITIALAIEGTIPYQTAAALVLGENIGTTITALLATIGANANARRAAYFHVLFNMLGVMWISMIFFQYVRIVPWLLGVDVVRPQAAIDNPNYAQQVTMAIATTHTIFNVINTLLFLPFGPRFAAFLERMVPEGRLKEKPHLTSLDIRMLETPVIAIEQSRVEIMRMADGCNKMMDWLKHCHTEDVPEHRTVQKLFHREEVLDTIQDEIVTFMTSLLSGNVPHAVITEGRCQLRMADEYESISDYITSIVKFRLKLQNQGHRFDEKLRNELLELHDMVTGYVRLITQSCEARQPDVITKARSMGSEITHHVKALRDQHLDVFTERKIEAHVNLAYTATLNSYRRVRDHAMNVAEALAGEK